MFYLKNNYICTLDIGSSKIASCVARLTKKRISEIYFEQTASKGIKKGAIVDPIELVGVISRLVKQLKAKSALPIKYLHVNISGQDILTKHSRAIIPLAERGNKVITPSDIGRVIDQARVLGSSLDEEIIHALPYSYAIDSKANIKNPLGLYSHKLEVDLYLICGKLASIQSLSRTIAQSGYEIKGVFFSGLATSNAVFDREQKEGVHVLCDIGSDTTELLVFRDGLLKAIEIIALGGDTMTSELQETLKIPFDLAEDIKRSHGAIIDLANIKEDKEILVKKSNFYKPIKLRAITEVINASGKLICLHIKEALEKKISLYEVSSLTVTGRSILLEGFIETLETTLSIPVKVAKIADPLLSPFIHEEGALSGHKYLTYLTCIGMLSEVIQDKPIGLPVGVRKPTKNVLLKAVNRFKEVYQEYF